jgi:hypothetical protein
MISDRSLFPGEYPDRVVTAPKRRACCGDLVPPNHIDPRLWEFVHDMAHGRVPFTASVLAELADCSLFDARRAVNAAQQTRWIIEIRKDPCFPGPAKHFIGQLRRKR